MTREEAQALAEREVLDSARNGNLQRLASGSGKTELHYAVGALKAGLVMVRGGLETGRLETGDVYSLAALLIEFLRECHLERYNTPRAEA